MRIIGTTTSGGVIVEWEANALKKIMTFIELVNGLGMDAAGVGQAFAENPVTQVQVPRRPLGGVFVPVVAPPPRVTDIDGLKACLVCGKKFKATTSQKLCGEICRKQRLEAQKAASYLRSKGKAAAPVPSKVDRLAAIKAAAQRLEMKSNPLTKAAEAHRRLQEEEG